MRIYSTGTRGLVLENRIRRMPLELNKNTQKVQIYILLYYIFVNTLYNLTTYETQLIDSYNTPLVSKSLICM